MDFHISPDAYAAKLAEVEKEIGAQLDSAGGVLSHEGVTLRYAYSAPVLTVDVVHKPWAMPEVVIESRVRQWFEGE